VPDGHRGVVRHQAWHDGSIVKTLAPDVPGLGSADWDSGRLARLKRHNRALTMNWHDIILTIRGARFTFVPGFHQAKGAAGGPAIRPFSGFIAGITLPPAGNQKAVFRNNRVVLF
jgi:hypothetical protein